MPSPVQYKVSWDVKGYHQVHHVTLKAALGLVPDAIKRVWVSGSRSGYRMKRRDDGKWVRVKT